MTCTLIIGNRAYSSWSLRGWLLFERFGLSCRVEEVDFSAGSVAGQLAAQAPAATVPAVVTDDGTVIWDSLAIAEELASRHPDASHWPADPSARATARSLAAEMHSGFAALRADCPMNLRASFHGFEPGADVLADLERIERIWAFARARHGGTGPWLCGPYSVADAFFAPVAARVAAYRLPVSAPAEAYVAAHLADPAFRRWRAMAVVRGASLPRYEFELPSGTWPGPAPCAARAVDRGSPENPFCPYSGKPVSHLMEMEGRLFGFCNAFCRDKTVADPEAWPAFTALL